MEWMEFIAFGCRALDEKRQRVRKGNVKLSLFERVRLEVAYDIMQDLLILIVVPVGGIMNLVKRIRKGRQALKALIKSIFNEIFPSEDMKNYLSENIDKLWSFRIIDMIAGSMAPHSRKLEMFIALD